MLYRPLKTNGTNSVFINPTNSTQTLKFNVFRQPKKLNGLLLTNQIVKIIANRNFDPRTGTCQDLCVPFNEPLRAEFIFSGSIQSVEVLDLMKKDLDAAYLAKRDELFKVGVAPNDGTGLEIAELPAPPTP